MSITNVRPIRQVCPIAVGETIQLIGGSSIMTVTDRREPEAPEHRWYIECCWHSEIGEPMAYLYPVEALCAPNVQD